MSINVRLVYIFLALVTVSLLGSMVILNLWMSIGVEIDVVIVIIN